MTNFENIIQHVFHPIVLLLDVVSISIIVLGAIFAFIKLIHREDKKDFSSVLHKNRYIKAYLGSYILLSLEFLIVADIIESIINPTFQDIIRLALIVLIRTMISYFLNKEISEFSEDQ
ncbi:MULTISPECIES: DUF1622 domain-containing protein [Enterococcus]|uniref:DUF1622 domain-containing protein n=1 Tax=Enterococcus malodoratus ATCC 43197 TaxID=1158601 RepID=R2RIH3_9ENTE|nr:MULTISPECIES: DUF1622 domain-containing protein [Enterococcus]EOH75804.1 hypothetical protein UAI_02813 [Enterococcus malodoratus ATCC 43197]EOT66473.1 hypothetical protein I585_01993 [Enterococcus malodoratus ATCC 43197]OJG64661.1 hypothetical protein RV07_GL004037 [Enterococcus malodoratus]SPW90450.1 Predicted membrane protein [Enterococcus malodoratus]STD69117.1 Predicted membrane protein [Enterococcus malodoratus]